MSSRRALGHLAVLSLGLLLIPPLCSGGRVLVYPAEGSHWINMKILIEEIHARGHVVTVIRGNNSWFIAEESPFYTTISVPDRNVYLEEWDTFLRLIKTLPNVLINAPVKWGRALWSIWTWQRVFTKLLDNGHQLFSEIVISILEDKDLMERFKNFDLFLTDPAISPGVFLGRYLKLPLVFNARWASPSEAHSVIAPYPLSYIPITYTGFTDRMTFLQRVENVLMRCHELYKERFVIHPHYKAILDKYFEAGSDLTSFMQEADIWLMRSDFVFEYPRPTMPNVVYMGGFQCRPAQPLPSELEEFVQSAGEHGVVIMSLGTLVDSLSKNLTDQIANVFANLPQKVIWKYSGERPSTLGNNTLLVKWMPQKDLLGHPQTRAFVAHGGTNGVQEAIYHGTPVVGIPLFFDQHDNLLRLQERGAAKILELPDLDGPNFHQTLKEVLHNPSYRHHMQRLSRLHRDAPIKPMDSAIFWLEFVMRNKGAPHLRTQAYRMPWYSYYCVDVLLLLLAAGGLLLVSTAALLRLLCCRGRRKTKTKLQ
ncbi:UDP-glucuronosyltransferase 2C1-like isoform X2 [Osmerus eperlanus]|uniref:UDP-glucuronosyltransferase 2C1-like isoform X2 n=1 Tax=Osmerus eperlanus TaxID=29151 RepID=UPI002E1341C9